MPKTKLFQYLKDVATTLMSRQAFKDGGAEKPSEAPVSTPKQQEQPGSLGERSDAAKKKIEKMVGSSDESMSRLSNKEVAPEKALEVCQAADNYFLESTKKSAYKDSAKAEAAMLSAADSHPWMKPAVDRYKKHADASGMHVFDPNVLATEVAEQAYLEVDSNFMEAGTNGTKDDRGNELVSFIYDEKKPENAKKAQDWFVQAKSIMEKGRAA